MLDFLIITHQGVKNIYEIKKRFLNYNEALNVR